MEHTSDSQLSPSHPALQTQIPLSHFPCNLQDGSQVSVSQADPFHPTSHWQRPLMQEPCPEHIRGHSLLEQRAPAHPGSHEQTGFELTSEHVPWPLQLFVHLLSSQVEPFQPTSQTHEADARFAAMTQRPRPQPLTQTGVSQERPNQPDWQLHSWSIQEP